MKRFSLLLAITCLIIAGCRAKKEKDTGNHEKLVKEIQAYLDQYNIDFQKYLVASAEAEWELNTHIVAGDTLTQQKVETANKAMAAFTGSKENIETAQKYLEQKKHLTPLQVRQLEVILYMAGSAPAIAGEAVEKKIKADAEQTKLLFGYSYTLNGKKVSTNDLDEILRTSNNLNQRLTAWSSSKEVGKTLKDGLENLRNLRNECVKPLGYNDYFHYQVSEYGYNSDELMKVCRDLVKDVWPLYRELHTWARYELARQYKQPVPDYIPAHWLPNRWAQDWTALVEVEGISPEKELKKKSAEWIVKEAENFYMSLGFDALPKSFYEKSSLYPLPPDAGYQKNNHASAWHMDNDKDVRSLMSVEPNTEWWETTLHELGHIYYYITYSNPDVPLILRGGANRAYHEAMGTQIGLASMQQPFLEQYNLIEKGVKTDTIKLLLKEALNYIVFTPFSAGVMTEFEYELYAKDLPKDAYNKKWWELVKKYQGVVPPSDRGEEYCDAATKTHINNDAAQYYDYAMSNVLLFQFHMHIAKNILKQDPHYTNYYGSKETGKFFKDLMYPGASVDWKEHLKKHIGEDMSAKSMLEYFGPLTSWLKEQNKGRTHTLPETL